MPDARRSSTNRVRRGTNGRMAIDAMAMTPPTIPTARSVPCGRSIPRAKKKHSAHKA
ncbi:hypothetical protein SALBM311S_07130 [Streptomyces alboniger]